MTSEAERGAIEEAVFRDFVSLSKLPFDLGTLQKRRPPEPGLLCQLGDEGPVAVELVELCDSNIAAYLANPVDGDGAYIRTSDPSAAIIRKKLRRKYETTYPIELLCYSDGRLITPPDVILPTILPYLGSFSHVFRRAWLLADRQVFPVWPTSGLNFG